MLHIRSFVLSAAAALAVTVYAGSPPPAPTKDALVALQASAYEAWKTRNTTFWAGYLSDKFVGYGSPGRLDKAAAAKEFDGAGCAIQSYALSDTHMSRLGDDAALLTFKASVDGSCGGQAIPPSQGAVVFVRDGDKWKSAFYADTPIVDPRNGSTTPAGTPPAATAKPSARDADTQAMLAVEKIVWEAWRVHDTKRLAELTASEISFVNIFGTYFATKDDALKDWSAPGCDVKSVSVTGAKATMLSPTVGILTFNGAADGTCYGQTVGPIWGTSVYVKDGKAWKWSFGMNVPAGP